MRPERYPATHAGRATSDDAEGDLQALIARFSLQDADDAHRGRGGASGSRALTDEELARQLQAEEVAALEARMDDMRLAHTLGGMGEWDTPDDFGQAAGPALPRAPGDNRDFAATSPVIPYPPPFARNGFQRHRPSTLSRVIPSSATVASVVSKSKKLMFWRRVRKGKERQEGKEWWEELLPSESSTPIYVAEAQEPVVCVVCMEDIHGPTVTAPCGHTYDVDCLVNLFSAATVDETLFPPACCQQPFDLGQVRGYLDDELRKRVDKKAIESGTQNRVYCHQVTCSNFIGAATPRASHLICTTCWAYTCGHCKGPAHVHDILCTSAEDAGVVALAEEAGWKRCPGCGHLVELAMGCYHMTCRCRYQFCYLCTAPWKTCDCVKWAEDRLTQAAEHRVYAQQQGPPGEVPWDEEAPVQFAHFPHAVPLPFVVRVAGEAERMRGYRVCVHEWHYIPMPGPCEGCGHYMIHYAFSCRWCYTRACNRCARNRWV